VDTPISQVQEIPTPIITTEVSQNSFSLKNLGLGQMWELSNVHPLVKALFPVKVRPGLFLAGKLKCYLGNWEKLTQDPQILQHVQGYKIPLKEKPFQRFPPIPPKLSPKEIEQVDREIADMIQKGAVEKVIKIDKDQFLSSIFLVPKKEEGLFRPVINLKRLNGYIPYSHFKMESLSLLKEFLKKGDFLCKIDLKDAYFSVPLSQESQKYVRFQWKGDIYQFLCLCFGLAPAPRVFTKLMKIPVALMHRLNVRLIIFLDDILLIAATRQEALEARGYLDVYSGTSGIFNQFSKVCSGANSSQLIQSSF